MFIFMLLVCVVLLVVICCAFALFLDILEDTELGQFIIMKIKNKYDNGDT